MRGRKKHGVQTDAVKKKSIWTNWRLYMMCLPAVVYLLLFNYKPMYGIIIAFKNYSMRKGIMGSPWIGFANFQRLFFFLLVSNHPEKYVDIKHSFASDRISNSNHSGTGTE